MPIRILPPGPALSEPLLDAVAAIDLPTLGHFLEIGFPDPRIRRLTGVRRLIGRAVTVRVVAPDSALVHRATEELGPGDVLVVDTGGDRRHAPVGGVVAAAVAARGAAGVVVDGPCTDAAALAELPLVVFSRGTSALTTKLHAIDAGGINVPVSIGGVPVLPGYLVVGDADGLLLTDPQEVAGVMERARRADEAEPAKLERLRAGEPLSGISVAGERLAPLLRPAIDGGP
jgi:4-hydroxy-4-methyl-2-oxoglutarate aldolase